MGFFVFYRVKGNRVTCRQAGIATCGDLCARHFDVFLGIQVQITSRANRTCIANDGIALTVIARGDS